MSNPFDQFDAPAAEGGNPFDQFDAPAAKKLPSKGILSDVGGAFVEGAKSAGRAIAGTANIYAGDESALVEKAQAQESAQAQKPAALTAFNQAVTERVKPLGDDPGLLDSVKAIGGAVVDQPKGAGLAVVEQLPNAAPAIAGGLAGMKAGAALGTAIMPGVGTTIGAIGGGLAGMFLGNTAIETGYKGIEAAQDGAVTQDEMSRVKKEGAVKAGVITGVDALTLGLSKAVTNIPARAVESATRNALTKAGVNVADEAAVLAARQSPEISAAVRAAQESAFASANTLGKRAAAGGAALGLETVGEGLGEYLGELAATGKANVADAVLEAMMSLGQSGAEVAWGAARNKKAEQGGMWDTAEAKFQPPPPTLVTEPEPLQQRIDALMGIDTGAMSDKERTQYEKDLTAAFLEPVGVTQDEHGLEIPFTMADYLNAQVRAEDSVRARPLKQNAADQSGNRLQQLADEETQQQPDIPGYVAPEIPVVGTLSAMANMAIQSGAHKQSQMQQAMQAAVEKQKSTSEGSPRAAQPEQMATQAPQANDAQTPAFDVSTRTEGQLSYLAQNGQPGWKEAAAAEIQRRGVQISQAQQSNTDAIAPSAMVNPDAPAANSASVPALKASDSAKAPEIQNGDGVTNLPTEKRGIKTIDRWSAEELQGRLDRGNLSPESEQRLRAELAKRQPVKQSAPQASPLTVGKTPNGAEPVTVRNGVVHVGDYPAIDYETEADITVPEGATPQQIADALRNGGALGSRKIFGLKADEQKPQEKPAVEDTIGWTRMTTVEREALVAKAGWAGKTRGINLGGAIVAKQAWGKMSEANRAKLVAASQIAVKKENPSAATGPAETKAPEQDPIKNIDAAANEAATSAKNDTPQPTEAQQEAGNYKKGHITVQGLNITIENPEGSKRSGTDEDGKAWEATMAAHYGYIKRTEGNDGDHVDVYVGNDPESDIAFIVDQSNADGSFDEHKVLLGFPNALSATRAYAKSYEPGWMASRVIAAEKLTVSELKDWLKNGDMSKPYSSKKADQPSAETVTAPEKSEASQELKTNSYSDIENKLINGEINVEDFMAATGLTDEDVGFLTSNDLNQKADNAAKEESPYFAAIKKLSAAIFKEMEGLSRGSTAPSRRAYDANLAKYKAAQDTLNVIAKNFEHPFRNTLIAKLPPFLESRYGKQWDGIEYGDKAKKAYRKDSYRKWVDLLIEAARNKNASVDAVSQPKTDAAPEAKQEQAPAITPQHVENGEAETATAAVVEQSLKKGAANSPLDLRQERDLLLKKVDSAIAAAPTAEEKDAWNRVEQRIDLTNNMHVADTIGYRIFDVPGDGKFKVLNLKEALQRFRERVETNPGFRKPISEKPKTVADWQKTGRGGTEATVKELLEDGEYSAAVEYAKQIGKPLVFGQYQDGSSVTVYTEAKPFERKGYDDFNMVSVRNPQGADKVAWAVVDLNSGLTISSKHPSRMKAIIETNKALDKTTPEQMATAVRSTKANIPGIVGTQEELEQRWLVNVEQREADAQAIAEAKNRKGRISHENQSNWKRIDDAVKPAAPAAEEQKTDYKGFERVPLGNGAFELRDGNMVVKVTPQTKGKFQASFRSAKSSPHLIGEQGAVDWAASYRNDATTNETGDQRYQRVKNTPPAQRSQADVDFANAHKAKLNERTQSTEKAAQQEKDSSKIDSINGFIDGKTPMQAGAIRKALNKEYRFDGVVRTVRQQVEWLESNGSLTVSTIEEPKIKPMDRRTFNRASQREQDAHEKKMREAGMKTTYLVGDSEIGKTAYDYAEYLIAKRESFDEKELFDKIFSEKLVGSRRNPEKVNIFNPYEDGDIVSIGGKEWQIRNDGGWYLTSTGNWRGEHPTIKKVSAMTDLIAMVEKEVLAANDSEKSGKPSPLELTPKQYHDARLKWIAERNGVPLSEVRESYDTDAGRKESEIEWVDAVRQAFKNGTELNRATLDKLEEIRPGAVAAFSHDYPEAKVPNGYQTPEARSVEKQKYNIAGNDALSPADKSVYGMVAEGKSAADILKFIASASRNPLNRQLAKLLLKTGIAPRMTVGTSDGWKFNAGNDKTYAAAYNPKANTVALFRPASAERHVLHELMHAATLKALNQKGLAAIQMKALFAHVKKSGELKGMYGMSDVDEFVAEAFTNPKFQEALKKVSAPKTSGTLSTAWNWFVRIVRGILGMPQGQENALSQAIEIGLGVMRENMALNDNARPQQEALMEMPAVSVRFRIDGDFETVKARARADYGLLQKASQESGQGAVTTDGKTVKFSSSGFKKASQHGADRRVLAVIANAKKLIESAMPLYSAEPGKAEQGVRRYHYYGVKANFGLGGDALVLLSIKESTNGEWFYDADATGVEIARAVYSAALAGRTKTGAGDTESTAPKGRLASWLAGVNQGERVRYNVADEGWSVAEPSKMDDVIYALQDKQIDMKRVVQSIMKTGKQIKDDFNAYLQEELFHGRAAKGVKDFLDFELRPLLKQMQEANVDMGDFEEYLWNRHAEERNKQIAKINPDMPDGGSGIETAKARAYLAGLSAEQRKTFEALAAKVEAMNRESQRVLIESGLEKQSTIDAWNGAYQHYVPLQREDVDSGHVGTGKGFSVRGSSTKRAMGSGRQVVDIIANLTMQRERNIVRAEKNRVSNALLGLAVQNPNPDFWKVDQAPKERVVEETAIYTVRDESGKKLDEFTRMDEAERFARQHPGSDIEQTWGDRVKERVTPGFTSRDNVLLTRINGDDHYVIFNERDERAMRMAMAMKNLDVDNLGRVLSIVGKATRYLASINTQYNPVFGVINLIRDAQGALINLSSTALAGEQKRVLGYTKDALVGIYKDIRAHRAGGKPSSNWAALFEEFQKEGGQTGYRDQYANAEARAEAIKAELEQFKDGKAKQFTRGLFGWLSDYNETMENAVRLAAYKAAKEKGMSNQQAASLAKNITVNFNRKGQMATQVGALYAFFNASVQGTARIAETLFEQHGGDIKAVRLSKKGKQIVLGGIMLGAMQALLLAAAGYGDDEPPEFVRERNLILPIGDGKYLTLAMPLGLHVIPGIGRIATEFVLSGGKDPLKRIAAFGSMFADAFNPVGSAGWSLQTITPSVVDPFAALAENKDFTGKEIYREDFNKLNPTPGHARAKDVATVWSRYISEALNFITGGTEFKPGLFSPSPDSIDYLLGQLTGGVGREANKVAQTYGATTSGEDLPLYKIPLVGRFVGDTEGQGGQSAKFYDAIKQINMHEAEYKGLLKSGRRQEASEYLAENPAVKLIMAGNHAESQVRKLRSMKRDLVDKDADKDQVSAIDERITATMRKFNERAGAAI